MGAPKDRLEAIEQQLGAMKSIFFGRVKKVDRFEEEMDTMAIDLYKELTKLADRIDLLVTVTRCNQNILQGLLERLDSE